MKKAFVEIAVSKIYIAAFLLLFLGVALTVGFWFRWYFALPALTLMGYASYKACMQIHKVTRSEATLRVNLGMILILLIIPIWLMALGVGGFIGQEQFDNSFRNAVLYELVNKPWPVTDMVDGQEYYLSYYFTYWLPAATLGKLFNSMTAAYLGLLIYAWMWIALTVLMVMNYCGGSRNFFIGILLLFFAPPIILNEIAFRWILGWYQDIYTHPTAFGSPTMTYNCFFIYNQTLPVVTAIPLMMRMREYPGTVAMALGMIFYYGPLETLPLIPVAAVLVFRNLKSFRTTEMCAAITMTVLISIFYLGNSNGTHLQAIWQDVFSGKQVVVMFIGYVIISIAVFLPFIWKKIAHNAYFWILVTTTLLLSFIMPTYGDFDPNGGNFDYGWKCPVALMFVLYMEIAKVCSNIRWSHNRTECVLLGLILTVGVASGYRYYFTAARHVASGIYPSRYPYVKRPEHRNGKLFQYDKEDPGSKAIAASFITPVPTLYSTYFMPERCKVSTEGK